MVSLAGGNYLDVLRDALRGKSVGVIEQDAVKGLTKIAKPAGVIASLIETCKLNAVDPHAYLAHTLTRLVNRHPASQIDQLMPWTYAEPVA